MSLSVIDRLVRPNIKALKPYQSARGTAEARDDFWFLDAAESPYCPFSDDDDGAAYYMPLNRYPEPQPAGLLRKLSDLYGVRPDQLAVARGSEEMIRLLMQVFCSPRKDAILTCPPTFALYAIEAQIHDIRDVHVPRLGEYSESLDVDRIVATARDPELGVKMVFLCNPGNPSSSSLPVGEVEAVIHQLEDTCMVVVDEAYIDFADHESFASKLDEYPNLIVMRTLSKSFGLAGLRLGAVAAHPEVVSYLRNLMAAYPVPRQTQLLAEAALSEDRLTNVQGFQRDLKRERERILAVLGECSAIQCIYPSETNFLCLRVADVSAVVEYFRNQKIVIRDRSAAIPGAINVAIGTKEQNDQVIALFQSL